MEIAGHGWQAWFGPDGLLRHPPVFLGLCLLPDVVLGDPQYGWHPVRVTGRVLAAGEAALRRTGLDGRFG
ncbi:MAG TPA: hypothetical protein VJ385_13780, partial [Fibrobacteria bacterium]|nr:hypothetical protein [Fibrobacteria bacterium]